MNLARRFFFVPFVASLLVAPVAGGDPAPPDHRSVAEIVQAVVGAEGPFAAAEQYRALFLAAGAKGLADLKLSPHDSIAIQAAWQEVNVTLPAKNPEDGNPVVFRPDRDKLNRFFGFLEGRGRFHAPKWWADSLLEARANTRSDIYFPACDSADKRAPPLAAVVTKGDKSVLYVGKDSVVLPAELAQKETGGKEIFSALITSNNVYVAKYDNALYPYTLARVNRADGRLVWKTEGWGSWWYQIGGSVGRAHVAIELQGDHVLVFGVSGLGLIHAEAFRADDGKSLFRFSNTYCEHN
jgi:hypothetical protein